MYRLLYPIAFIIIIFVLISMLPLFLILSLGFAGAALIALLG
jgi:hypothetical protein